MSCGRPGIRQTISSVCSEMGFPTSDGQDSFHELLPEAQVELGDRADEFMDPMEAGAELRSIIRSLPGTEEKPSARTLRLRDEVMEGVESGRIRFTRAEMLALSRMPAHVHVDQALGAVDGEEYRALVEQRNCELCHQFIGRRVAHVNCGTSKDWQKTVVDRGFGVRNFSDTRWIYDPSLARVELTPGEDVVPLAEWPGENDGVDPEAEGGEKLPLFARNIRKSGKTQYSFENVGSYLPGGQKSVDYYFATPMDTEEGKLVRDAIILHALKSKKFGGGMVCKVPREISLGVVDDPSQATQRGIYVLAQFGREEYTGTQVRRMLDVGGAHAAEPLLTAPRTRAKALAVLRDDPELAPLRRDLATRGYLPDVEVLGLATSPDPADRAAAAVAPNIRHVERARLARDESSVAMRMAESVSVAVSDPEAFRALLSHPDEQVRSRAASVASSRATDPVLKNEGTNYVMEAARREAEVRAEAAKRERERRDAERAARYRLGENVTETYFPSLDKP